MRIVTLTTTFRTNPCCWRIASILPARKGNSPFGVCNRNRRMPCNSNSHSSCYSLNPMQKKKVAVIGAGAAGLVAARELHREGHEVSVFEQSSHVGGTWIYDPSIEQDPLGLHPSRNIVHSSMYASLRTNLPRDVMGFSDYAFRYCPETDCRRFPGHHEVALYIRSFAQHFGLLRFIKFNTRVERVCRMGESGESCVKWKVQSRHSIGGDANVPVQQQEREETEVEEGIYDAVVVCNGHHTQPRIAAIPGIKKWPGKQIHSHNYRIPDPFRGKVVVVIGNSASGSDISQELTSVAKEVHLSARSIKSDDVKNARCFKKIMLHPMVQSLLEDGTVKFQDGNAIVADSIIHCTGYCYHFPFLETDNIVTVEDNCVGPLYKHIFPPLLAPSLSFVGLPWKVLPFIMFELQSRWIAKLLSGKVELPPENEMMEDVASFYSEFNKSGRPKHQTHMLGDIQFEYDNWLCDQCGCMRVEEWRKEIYFANTDNRKSNLEMYRDKWNDHYWLEMATLDLSSRTGYGNLSNPSQ